MIIRDFLIRDLGDQNYLPDYLRIKSQMIPGAYKGILLGGDKTETEEIKPGILRNSESVEPAILRGGEAAEEIKPGVLRIEYTPATYRTKCGRGVYKFRYVDLGNYFEIDILSQPSYNGRSFGGHITHRLSSSRGGYKICIASPHVPKTIDVAKKMSTEWSDLTQTYINTGKTIDKQLMEKENSKSLWKKIIG